MKNTCLEREIENLHYITVERVIARYFNMGSPDNSNIPPLLQADSSDQYILVCTQKSGTFNISIHKQTNGKYLLQVSLVGKLNKV